MRLATPARVRASDGSPPPVAAPRAPRRARRTIGALLTALSFTVAGCASPDTTVGPRSAWTPSGDLVGSLLGGGLLPGVLDCAVLPGTVTRADTAVIGPAGGRLAVDRTTVDIPAGAVAAPETFVLTVPVGRLVRVDVAAVGREHYQFAAPVTLTLDYGRCGDLGLGDTDGGLLGGLLGGGARSLHGWYVDSETGAPIEDMGGVTDRAARTHSFRTPHFSNYLLAE